ncbi:MAG: ABC transporter substrate-binding protein [Catonella sp.]|uniref:ABC transporter substrate-binding protein n=1 Tax=Catonella sp. TaxID=2382125 RepID=UPI003FA08BD8
MKKRLLSLLACAAVAVTTFTACGGNAAKTNSGSASKSSAAATTSSTKSASATTGSAKQAAAEPVTVEFWTISLKANFEEFFNKLIADYQTANPNVTINWVDVPYDDVQSKLVTAVAGGTAPDVVNFNTQMALTLVGQDALVDLNKAATEEQKSIYIESLWNSAKVGDSVYAFPWYASPDIMFYNQDLMKKGGIEAPATFDQALEKAEKFYNDTKAYLFQPDEFFNLLIEENIPILNEDGTEAAFNTQAAVDLLTKYKTYTDKGVLPKTNWGSWDEALKLFESGKLAIVSSSGSSLGRIKDEAPDIYKTIAVSTPLTGSTGLSRNPLMNLVVPTASKNQEAAIAFANYITNDANQLAFCKTVSIFPSTKKASEDSFFTSDTATLEGQASAMSAKASLTSQDFSLGIANQGTIQTAINKAYEASIINGDDIAGALKQAEEDVNKILAENK